MEQQERSKMLGTMEMGKLVTKVSVPIMVSMLVQALYNVVDGIFVARYSADALTAVSLAFPVQMLMIAVATGLGVGINSLISRKLGEKRTEEARSAAKNGVLLELGGYLLFLLIGLFAARGFFRLFTPEAALQEMAGEYLTLVCVFSFGLFLAIAFERMMQATGNTMLSMTTQLIGAVINIVLDPILIFGLLGMPRMGVAGGDCDGYRADRRHGAWLYPQPDQKQGAYAVLEGFPPGPRDCQGHSRGGLSQHHHAVHLLGDERVDEPDSDGLRQCRGERAGRLFQTAILCIHAGVWPEQRTGCHCGL